MKRYTLALLAGLAACSTNLSFGPEDVSADDCPALAGPVLLDSAQCEDHVELGPHATFELERDPRELGLAAYSVGAFGDDEPTTRTAIWRESGGRLVVFCDLAVHSGTTAEIWGTP